MFLGRDSCALALPATRPLARRNPLTLLFPLHSVHSRATTFKVNTYEKAGGWGIPSSVSRDGYRITRVTVFFRIYGTTARLSPVLSSLAHSVQKKGGDWGIDLLANTKSQIGARCCGHPEEANGLTLREERTKIWRSAYRPSVNPRMVPEESQT